MDLAQVRRDFARYITVALLVGAGLTRAGLPGAYATVLAALACVAVHAALRAIRGEAPEPEGTP